MVHTVDDTSAIGDQIRVGDLLLKVDGVDCIDMTAFELSEQVSKRCDEPGRLLYFGRKAR